MVTIFSLLLLCYIHNAIIIETFQYYMRKKVESRINVPHYEALDNRLK